jgi:2-oxoglutarate dehydrogenase E1 component
MNVDVWQLFPGPNAAYALELYERYLKDPASVDERTRAFFAEMTVTPPTTGAEATVDVAKVVGAARLARSIREYGHLAADLDPLGTPPRGDPALDPATHGLTEADLARLPAAIVWPDAGPQAGTCLDAVRRLRAIYCGALGYDFSHVHDYEERDWLRETVETGRFAAPLPAERRRELLRRLSQVEAFERYLHTHYLGQKRFSIEGTDMLVPMLDEVIADAAQAGTREILIGMAHRGRLNVLAHVLGKPYAAIFAEFHAAGRHDEVAVDTNQGWSGDVKYHLGAQKKVQNGSPVEVQLTLANNPSHLEFVNPVVEGLTRAAQEDREVPGAPRQDTAAALAILIHGDAAFPGEGVVAETLNLSRLPGYQTGGTIHIIVNNQLGFTTDPHEGRSTLYASDLAKGFEIPIIHVNADRPEACLTAMRIAFAYRQTFHKDILIDLIGYRRWGHNEGDEPSFTQPVLYNRIQSHPTVRALYAAELAAAGVVRPEEADAFVAEAEGQLQAAQEELETGRAPTDRDLPQDLPPIVPGPVPAASLVAFQEALVEVPEGFHLNPKLRRLLDRRLEAVRTGSGIDWAQAESLAFAAILADGIPIRLAGQDSVRGTFSQRHLAFVDVEDGRAYIPLQHLPQARASFAVYNSPLSEAAALGFEYGYQVHAPSALVLWEAQFGDFANAAQVIIDQFLVAARAKWRERSALVLLLPHGYEGQGPEHSSARVERYLQLAAEDNITVANCTTAAQYFHLLRLQAANLERRPRPLVLLTPKSLLRHPLAAATLTELAEGSFRPVLTDGKEADPAAAALVERVVLASGKVAVDLLSALADREPVARRLALVRVERLYPFPAEELGSVLKAFPNAAEVVWLQEEPRNMGAYGFVAPRLAPLLPPGVALTYIGRPERASTAEGSADVHAVEQARIVEAALTLPGPVKLETRGVGKHAR